MGVSLECIQHRTLLTGKLLKFAFVRELSKSRDNTVIGLVRDKSATDAKIAEELGSLSNIHILEADITNYEALKVEWQPTT